jgi:LPXTG-site transpeptidase (sortase) family protein
MTPPPAPSGTTVRAAAPAVGPGPAAGNTGRARTARPAGPGLRIASTALTILAALLLGFVVDAGLLSHIRHARDRQVDYATLRGDLANGVAPVGTVAAAQSSGAGAAGPGVKPLKPGALLAVLSIPELHVREVLHEGTTARILARGPGHRRDTPLPGQAGVSVIMARQATYGGPFRHIGDLHAGDTFSVTTGQGVARYRVIGVRRSGDPQPSALPAGQGRLTLITASGTPFMPSGILRVDADLVSQVQPGDAPPVAPEALPADEKPMAVEGDGWLPLVLWGQGLLLAAAALTWAQVRWGRRQTWVVGVPLLAVLGLVVADNAAQLLPNLM